MGIFGQDSLMIFNVVILLSLVANDNDILRCDLEPMLWILAVAESSLLLLKGFSAFCMVLFFSDFLISFINWKEKNDPIIENTAKTEIPEIIGIVWSLVE